MAAFALLSLCSNVFGFIFLYKWERTDIGNSDNPVQELDFEADVFFAKQEISNACATQAILHILLNADEKHFERGEILSNFLSFAKDLPADMRGLCLSNSLEIRQAHNEFGNLEEYLAFGDDDEDNDKAKNKSQEPFHFVAFIYKDSTVYELDGLKDAPVKYPCSDGLWTEKVLKIICDRITGKQEVRFSLMAVVDDQRESLKSRLQELTDRIEANTEDCRELKAERFKLQQLYDDEVAKWTRYRKDWEARKREMAKVAVPTVKAPALSAPVQNLLKSLESKGLFKSN